MRLLVVEDNSRIASSILRGLSEDGHKVDVCETALAGERAATSCTFDAIVLDVGLPDRCGLHLCKSLREQGVNTPVLVLTVLDRPSDRVRGFNCGADDYLGKPFDFEELKARLHALHRRSRGHSPVTIKHADIELDPATHTVRRAGQLVTLTRREFDLLTLFMKNPYRVYSRDAIASAIWDHQFDPQSNVIDVHVCTLRSKINSVGSKLFIRTVFGRGYSLASAECEVDCQNGN
jgi:DNA-binding response OmpR family regulator